MQRPLLGSQQQHAPSFGAEDEGTVSLVSARAIPRGSRNWVVSIKLNGASFPLDDKGAPLTPELDTGSFHLERLDGNANRAFIIKKVEWIQAPSILHLHLFMDARASELVDQHLYQHVLKLVNFPSLKVNSVADRVPLFLLPSQPKDSNAYGMRESKPTPLIDYTAKDFESMRKLMITNIKRVLPKWQDETAADIGNMLLEILAYVGDYLSYRQDFAANEAYLRTALLRTSISRHARLLGYFPREGCTQRTVLTFQVSKELSIPQGFSVLSSHSSQQEKLVTKNSDLFNRMIAGGSACYETRHAVTATPDLNSLRIHDFGLQEYTLFAGTTAAILEFPEHLFNEGPRKGQARPVALGSIIVFHQTAEMAARHQGNHQNLLRAHAVRLSHVEQLERESHNAVGKTLVRIRWNNADALPRDLPVTMKLGRREDAVKSVAVVFANAVEAEYGLTRSINVERPELVQASDWQPSVAAKPLWSAPVTITEDTSVNSFLDPDSHLLTYPTIRLEEQPILPDGTPGLCHNWQPTRDLLRHGNSSRVFMVDTNEDETITLRFGKHGMGRTPSLGCKYTAHVREAVGSGGSVGTNVLTIAAPEGTQFKECAERLLQVDNPMPATARRLAESKEAVRLKAPESIRNSHVCATLGDYEKFAEKISTVRAARGWLIDTGPWPYIHIAILAKGKNVVDDIFAAEIKKYLNAHRPLGRRLIISGPTPVPIEIGLNIVPEEGRATLSLERKILAALGNSDQYSENGLFSLSKASFDQTLFPSDIVTAVSAVPGISETRLTKFRRMDSAGPSVAEVLIFTQGEIPMFDCQDDDPAGGRITINFDKKVSA